jgi:hypothetical protein
MKPAMILIVTCAVLPGCCVMTSVDVRNDSRHLISVQSTHTGKSYDITAGSRRGIPHTSGDLIVTLEGFNQVARMPICVMDYEAERIGLLRSWPCWSGLRIRAEFSDVRGLVILTTPRTP